MINNLSKHRAGHKGRPLSNTTGCQSIMSAISPQLRSPKAKPPVQPPTVGSKVQLGADQVQSASALKIMSPSARRLFDMPPDSQNILFSAKDKVALGASPAPVAKSVQNKKDKIIESMPDILSDDEGYISEDFQNCPMVKAILQDSPRTKAKGEPKCTQCQKTFDNKRQLKIHEKYCRREGANRLIIC